MVVVVPAQTALLLLLAFGDPLHGDVLGVIVPVARYFRPISGRATRGSLSWRRIKVKELALRLGTDEATKDDEVLEEKLREGNRRQRRGAGALGGRLASLTCRRARLMPTTLLGPQRNPGRFGDVHAPVERQRRLRPHSVRSRRSGGATCGFH